MTLHRPSLRSNRSRTARSTIAAIGTLLIIGTQAPANSETLTTYDFNTAGDLTTYFEPAGPGVANVTQSTNTGIAGSGAIAVPLSSVNAVYSSREGYSIGPIGSRYVFSTSIKSEGNSGYSGVGFTTSTPSVGSGVPYRPSDALGVSVHGGGFVVHNAGQNFSGSWASGGSGITPVTTSSCSDLINNNTACGSPDKWFRFFFTIERVSTTLFDATIEVWPSDSDGTLRFSEATAKFEVNGLENDLIRTSPQIFAYFNFSGVRVTAFDDYRIDLSGGATVVAAGAPVVITDVAESSGAAIEVDGNVTFDGGSSVAQRGFVYSTSANPTLADDSVVIGSGTGTFSGSVTPPSPGTYKVRTFATNAMTTSYGAEVEVTISGSSGGSPAPASSGSPSLALSCLPEAPQAGDEVSCEVTGGEANFDVLWLATGAETIASEGVRLGTDGAGTFTFRAPASAPGSSILVELVAWGVETRLPVSAPVPVTVPAGEGPAPIPWPLALALVAVVALGPVAGTRRMSTDRR